MRYRYRPLGSSTAWNHDKEVLEVNISFTWALDLVRVFAGPWNCQFPSSWQGVVDFVYSCPGQRDLPRGHRISPWVFKSDCWVHSFGCHWNNNFLCGIINRYSVCVSWQTPLLLSACTSSFPFFQTCCSCQCPSSYTRQLPQLFSIRKFQQLTTRFFCHFFEWLIRRAATQTSGKKVYSYAIFFSNRKYFFKIFFRIVLSSGVCEDVQRWPIIWTFSHRV